VVTHDNHHVIASLDEIIVQKDSTKYSAEWEPTFSDMQKDIARTKSRERTFCLIKNRIIDELFLIP
jgi:hypothetical protein